MTGGTLFWYIIGGISAVLFFGIAAVVTWRGTGELRRLLRSEDGRDSHNRK
jgi:hypothetical protein